MKTRPNEPAVESPGLAWPRPLGLALALLCCVVPGGAVTLDEAPRTDLAGSLQLLRDRGGRLDVAAAAARADFAPATARDLTPGFSRDVFWLKFSLDNPASEPALRWLAVGHPRMESVTLYWPEASGWRAGAAGTAVPLAEKLLPLPKAVFPVTLRPGETRGFLLRISSPTAIGMEAALWKPVAYLAAEQRSQFVHALVIGGALTAGLMTLGVFALLREPIYLYFGLTLALSAGVEAAREGLLQRYFWPPGLPFYLPAIPWLGGAAALCFIRFQEEFLNLRARLPRGSHFFKALAVAILAGMIGSAFAYWLWVRVVSAAVLGMLFASLAINAAAWLRGFRPARLLTATFAAFWVLEGLRQLANLGVLRFPAAMAFSAPGALLAATPLILVALTERGRELRILLGQVKAESEARIDFLARMSHELRTPLSTILGYARLLASPAPRATLAESVAAIDRSGRHLLGMIDEILDYARGETGRLALNAVPVDWREFLEDLKRHAALLASAANNRFVLDARGDFPETLKIDPRRLRQVLDNLLVNANRYAPDGEVKLVCAAEPRATVGPAAETGTVRLSFEVVDQGSGIPSAEQESVFLPFMRGQNAQQVRGSGMGLAIAKQLVGLMGGELALDSVPNRGCRFYFSIIGCPSSRRSASAVPGPWIYAGRRRRILVVDDDPSGRFLLAALLAEHGFETAVADGVEPALSLQGSGVDLIITDQFMGRGDGWALLRASKRACPGRPVLLLSAAPPARPARHPASIEFSAILLKPADEAALLGCLARLLALEWETRAEPPSEAAVTDRGKGAQCLDAVRREALQSMVRDGQVTDIVNWAAELAKEPLLAEYAAEISDAARRIDLARLAALSGLDDPG